VSTRNVPVKPHNTRRSQLPKVAVLHGIGWPGQNRRGVHDEKGSPSEAEAARQKEPRACDRCGALFARRTWRFNHRVSGDLLDRVRWDTCPACAQRRSGIAYGRVVLSGAYLAEHEDAIRRRIGNVAARAQATQPERRVLSIDRDGERMEVLTTSQRLAHRIVKELKKVFGGRVRYVWDSSDGALYATWAR
jgi:hypothetical protein